MKTKIYLIVLSLTLLRCIPDNEMKYIIYTNSLSIKESKENGIFLNKYKIVAKSGEQVDFKEIWQEKRMKITKPNHFWQKEGKKIYPSSTIVFITKEPRKLESTKRAIIFKGTEDGYQAGGVGHDVYFFYYTLKNWKSPKNLEFEVVNLLENDPELRVIGEFKIKAME